ncbi:MAG: delta-60 repeat domain-containing protein [Candidatus Krumholzibacteria bacterium]
MLIFWAVATNAVCLAGAGDRDSSFGTGGLVTTDSGFDVSEVARAVAIQADGKIIAAGRGTGIGGTDFALVRYNTDGSLDATFGTGGVVTTDFAADSRCSLNLTPCSRSVLCQAVVRLLA